MVNPLDFYAIDDLRFVTGMPIHIAVSSQRDIVETIEMYYPKNDLEKALGAVPGLGEGVEIIKEVEEDEKEEQDLLKLTELPPVVRFVNSILADALRLKASDIHIEPHKDAVIIRYRIDGIMCEIMQTDKHVHASLVSRVKILSDIDISIRRKPQDGRSHIRYGNKGYDLRVSTIPTSYGEKVTIRILNPDTVQMTLNELGVLDKDLKKFINALSMPQGIILVTGPTGSGKSSTLYACLNRLNTPKVNIITVEDPVEFDIDGINQVQINPKAGITFAAGLRSILRQDPDIIMVGEIRDTETAGIAFQAAQTGQLVLSTLHTNDASSAVGRLQDMGVDSFLVSSSLVAVIGQRLVRKICKKCKVPDPLSAQMKDRLSPYIGKDKSATFWKGAGCEDCQYSGYSGRLGLFEILLITPSLKEIIVPNMPAVTLKKAAEKEGFQSLSEEGIKKALKGLTTIEEIFRVAPPEARDIFQEPVTEPGIPDEKETETAQLSRPSVSVSSVRSTKILVADDNEVTLKILCHLLKSENYLTIAAKNGVDALKLAYQEKPDLLVTDYMMPEMDGITLIKKLRSQLTTRYIPIIMLTAKKGIDSEIEGIDAGADDYLTKPVNPKRFLSRVSRLLNRPIIGET